MPEESLTPEERLLRLIRRRNPSSPAVGGPKAPSPKQGKKRSISFPKLPRLSLSLPHRTKPSLAPEVPWILNDPVATSYFFDRTQKILFVLIGMTLLFLFTSRFLPRRQMSPSALLQGNAVSSKTPTQEPATAKPYEYYGKVLSQRDLFQPGLPSKEEKGNSPSLKETRFKDLTLIGILSGKTPQAIIEDKKESKTYFLKEGELLGEMRVEQILNEKVTLSYEGEQFELLL